MATCEAREPKIGTLRPLKVVIIHNVPSPIRTPLFARLAADVGLDLEVWFLAGSMPGRTWDTSVNVGFRWRVLTGRHIRVQREDLLHLHYNPSLVRALSRHRPDVLVIGGWESPSCWIAAVWARLKQVPYIVWSGSFSDESAHGGTTSHVAAARRLLGRSIAHRVVAGAAGGLAYGSLSSSHLGTLGLSHSRIWTAWNSIDEAALIKQAHSLQHQRDELRFRFDLPSEACVAVFVGRLQPIKRTEDLLLAASRVGRLPRPLSLLIVGDGPQRAELEQLAKTLRVHAVFAGALSQPSVLAAYLAADFLVLPSTDIWGLVVNEALALGLPVIAASSVGSAADLLQGEAGITFSTGDVNALANAIESLVVDPNRLARMSTEAPSALDGKGTDDAAAAFVDAIRTVGGTQC